MHPVPVVLLLQDLCFGGTQRQALELARHLDPRRFAVQVWTLLPGADFAPLAAQWGLPVRALSQGARVGPGCLLALWRGLRAERPRLLLPMTVVPNVWGRIFGRLAGVEAIIGSCRGGGAELRQHERLLWPLTRHIVVNSRALGDSLVGRCKVPQERVSVVLNGVDLEGFGRAGELRAARPAAAGPVILSLGRFSEAKDQAGLVRAFASLAEKHPTARLRLLGDGPLRPRVTALADELFGSQRPQRVEIGPAELDVVGNLGGADVFALASHRESLPNVVLEAMAAGLPVAASDVGGVGELVRHEETGLLVPAGDHEAMARALDSLLAAPERRQAMGEAGRLRAQAYSFPAMAEAFTRIMEQALTGRRT